MRMRVVMIRRHMDECSAATDRAPVAVFILGVGVDVRIGMRLFVGLRWRWRT